MENEGTDKNAFFHQGTISYHSSTGLVNSVSNGFAAGATYPYAPGTNWISETLTNYFVRSTRTPDALYRLKKIDTWTDELGYDPPYYVVPRPSVEYTYVNGRRTAAKLADGSEWRYSYNDRSEVIGGTK